MSNTSALPSVIFKVRFEDRFITPVIDSITTWLTKNSKDRQKTDLPKDLFIVGFEINGTFYPLPEDLYDEEYALRSTKQESAQRYLDVRGFLDKYLCDNDSSEHAII